MWLKMDLDGIIVSLQVRGYKKVADDDWDSTWCKTDFSFISEPWLNYQKRNDEVFLAREIDGLSDVLKALLENRLAEKTEFNCIEPDFNFTLNPVKDLRLDPNVTYVSPGHEFVDIDMEWQVSFWHDGLTANYLSVTLSREEIEYLLTYLRLVTGEICEDDPAIKRLIQMNIIY
ncbi:MAG: hypothetical protein Q4F17_10285 [Eubacteriales bacterium]|nr:hypothetical protein [Eubacteriales bacterium]